MKRFLSFMVIVLGLFCFHVAEAQQAIFLVRHAETVAPKGTAVRPLSEAGQRRAVSLATLLRDAEIVQSSRATQNEQSRLLSLWQMPFVLSRRLLTYLTHSLSKPRLMRLPLSLGASMAVIRC